MRARNIKPGFFENEALAELPPLARILFAGLWCYADREGRFEWRPKRIKALILPYDDCDIEALLMSLHAVSFITKYTAGDEIYGEVCNFKEHQRPHPHEAKSTIPQKPEQNQCHDNDVPLHGDAVTCQGTSVKCPSDIRILGYSDSCLTSVKPDEQGSPATESKPSKKSSHPVQEKPRGHFSTQIPEEDILGCLIEVCNRIRDGDFKMAEGRDKAFNPFAFIQANVRSHPLALLRVLERIAKEQALITTPWGYANKILAVENGNYHEADAIAAHEEMKRQMAAWEKAGGLKNVRMDNAV